MHQTKKGQWWYFGMKSHIGVDAESGWVHSVSTAPANALLHGEEKVVFADSGYRGIIRRQEIQTQYPEVDWQVGMMPGKPVDGEKENFAGHYRMSTPVLCRQMPKDRHQRGCRRLNLPQKLGLAQK